MTLDLSVDATYELVDYLLEHEDDIAWSINDFDYIRSLFIEVIGRNPTREIMR